MTPGASHAPFDDRAWLFEMAFAGECVLAEVTPGDLLVIMSAGAYGASLSSQYNARPLVPEVLVDGSNWHIVRKRPTFDKMGSLEAVPDWLN